MTTVELIVSMVGLLGTGIVTYLGYKQGTRAEAAAQLNPQVYEAYGGLLQRIQNDNEELRAQVIELRERLATAEERITSLLEQLGQQNERELLQ